MNKIEFRARIGSNPVWVEAEVDIHHEDYTAILAVTLMDSDEKMLAPLDIEDLFVINTRTGAIVPALQEIKFLAEEKAYDVAATI